MAKLKPTCPGAIVPVILFQKSGNTIYIMEILLLTMPRKLKRWKNTFHYQNGIPTSIKCTLMLIHTWHKISYYANIRLPRRHRRHRIKLFCEVRKGNIYLHVFVSFVAKWFSWLYLDISYLLTSSIEICNKGLHNTRLKPVIIFLYFPETSPAKNYRSAKNVNVSKKN